MNRPADKEKVKRSAEPAAEYEQGQTLLGGGWFPSRKGGGDAGGGGGSKPDPAPSNVWPNSMCKYVAAKMFDCASSKRSANELLSQLDARNAGLLSAARRVGMLN